MDAEHEEYRSHRHGLLTLGTVGEISGEVIELKKTVETLFALLATERARIDDLEATVDDLDEEIFETNGERK